jgi:hypothetical protein
MALKVPSSIVPGESLYILNPKHRDFGKVKIINSEIFRPDNRLVLLES